MVQGITSASVLHHTANLLDSNTDDKALDIAAIDICERVSEAPIGETHIREHISDNYKFNSATTERLLKQIEIFQFIDSEKTSDEKLFFNGNLFKKDNINKTNKILNSLKSEDQKNILEFNELLNNNTCVLYDHAEKIIGHKLLLLLQSIGMYDFNEVSNNNDAKIYITAPAAFSKFKEKDAICDDLNLAKAFIASLFFGMEISTYDRGRIVDIEMIKNTLKKLMRGEDVGPCTAIGEDYKYLEGKRVIQIIHYGNRYKMRLLKFDIAQIALSVIEDGDLSELHLLKSDSNSIAQHYKGPEALRSIIRKQNTDQIQDLSEHLKTLRL